MSQLRALLADCKGALLLETVIAVMVFSLVGVAVLAGLSTAYTSGSLTEEQSVSENLARNQMESIFGGPYREPQQTPYPTMTGIPTDYFVNVPTPEFEDPSDPNPDPEVEKITVTSGRDGKEILTLQTLRGRDDGLQLRYSVNDNRDPSHRLHDADIGSAGSASPCPCAVVYVFLEDPETKIDNEVHFHLDEVSVEPPENSWPWDFKGGDVATANPWNTDDETPGTHVIKGEVSLLDGNTVNVTATFTISN